MERCSVCSLVEQRAIQAFKVEKQDFDATLFEVLLSITWNLYIDCTQDAVSLT